MKKRSQFFLLVIPLLFFAAACAAPEQAKPKEPPAPVPPGILADQIPEEAEILFVSMRYILDDLVCLDEGYHVKENFINDPVCNQAIYNPELNVLIPPRQIYALDLDTGGVQQLTNVTCDFSSIKPIDNTRIMAAGMCADTDGDGLISTRDEPEVHLIDLAEKKIDCLTCEFGLRAINNPDYSQTNGLFIFSAQWSDYFHNYLFTLNLEGNLVQLTENEEYMDFDCSWSEDGSMVVFNRLPAPFFSQPAQVWLMNKDGSGQQQMTSGGTNPGDEEPHGPYPIGLDADPDLSPDNSQIVFSRLRTGKENEPFGVYDLAILDINSREITIVDSSYANMVPEWKVGGILIIRQIGSMDQLMERKQSIYLYADGKFKNLEPDFDVFPIGSNGASWVE
jgi:hypothetical protein